MSHTTKEDTLYYRSMTLTGKDLTIQLNELGKEICIFHSPRRWNDSNFQVHLTSRKDLQAYILMLQDFEQRYGDLLDDILSKKESNNGRD